MEFPVASLLNHSTALMLITHCVLRNRSEQLHDDEREVLEASVDETRVIPAGRVVVHQGDRVGMSTLLVEGMMTRHVDGKDGHRRLVAVHVPGDFVDLHAYPLKTLDHDVATLTEVKVAVYTHSTLERIEHDFPPLTKRLWFMTLLDAALHRQWICRLSSLNALQRLAHFLCEMNARLLAIDESDGRSFELPMTQSSLGEVCALTNVHVNRVLRQLREMELCTVRASQVNILDLKRLAETAQFTPAYLYLNSQTTARAGGGSLH